LRERERERRVKVECGVDGMYEIYGVYIERDKTMWVKSGSKAKIVVTH
jgi:hypothetical protein